jgi:hypothetical protein
VARIAIFIVSVVAGIAVIGLVEWRADPFGDFYDASVITAARASSPPCIVSDDLVGPSAWVDFKFGLASRDRPRVVVVGTSRVLKMEARSGEHAFVNMGLPATTPEGLSGFFQRLHRVEPGRLTVYVGADYFWFNHEYIQSFATVPSTTRDRIRQLLTRQRLGASLSRIFDYPSLLLHRWHRVEVSPGCGLDRANRLADGKVQAWRVDGALDYPWEIVRNSGLAPSDDYSRDLTPANPALFGGGYYHNFTALDPDRLRQLDDILRLAQSFGWRVVGFVSPYSPRYVERLSTAPVTKSSWKEYGRVVPEYFHKHGFPFLDFRDVRDVPCAPTAFVDDGWHPNAQCMDRVRARLEAALKR